MVLINPGSGPIAEGEDWANTYDGAVTEARKWLAEIRREGIADVELFTPEGPVEPNDSGRWRFEFRHQVTGVSVFLETHGIDDMAAYLKARVFDPRVYWNGSSCSTPKLADWAAPGFKAKCTFVAGVPA